MSDRMTIRFPPQTTEGLEAQKRKTGVAANAYVNLAVHEKLARDGYLATTRPVKRGRPSPARSA